MNEDTTFTGFTGSEHTDNSLMRTYTQIASCAVGENRVERRQQTLRAKLEREAYQREQELNNFFIRTFRNLLRGF